MRLRFAIEAFLEDLRAGELLDRDLRVMFVETFARQLGLYVRWGGR